MSEHGHHEENFFSKYVFSTDHKMIAKQFLLTGMNPSTDSGALVPSLEMATRSESVLKAVRTRFFDFVIVSSFLNRC
jgi:hypothetical protein